MPARYFAVLLFFIAGRSTAQVETSRWFFGHQAGLDFTSGSPVADTRGSLISIEGSTSVSDANGRLLFYTNGETLWNRNHRVMANGSNLEGNNSAVQAAMILPVPGSDAKYYVFTNASASLSYSVVDMQLDGGAGAVVAGQKNILLHKSGTESLAATRHCNNGDFWVVSRTTGTALTFKAYLVCAAGVTGPVVSQLSIPTDAGDYVAHLKFSSDGRKMAAGSFATETHLLDFDKGTGRLTLDRTIPSQSRFREMTYATAFSPDNSKLYVSAWDIPKPGRYYCNLLQYDLTAPDLAASRVLLDTTDFSDGSPNSYGFRGNMQLGPDGKLYVCRWKQSQFRIFPDSDYTLDSLDVINEPNARGKACRLVRNQVWLKGRPTMIGLPNFPEIYGSAPPVPTPITADFAADTVCQGGETAFRDRSGSPCGINNVAWDFGDPASGEANASTAANPTHRYALPGTYRVTLRAFSGCASAVVTKSVYVSPTLAVRLGNDTTLCQGQQLLLTARVANASYRWQDGSRNPSLSVNAPGTYWVEVQSGSCRSRDSIVVNYLQTPVFSLGNDAELCEAQSLVLQAPRNGLAYRWQDGTAGETFTVTQPGTYWATASNAACSFTDTIRVTRAVLPTFALRDTVACLGRPLRLSLPGTDLAYTWSNGSTGAETTIDAPGSYWVEYRRNGASCSRRETFSVDFRECLDDLFVPNVITPNGDRANDTFVVRGAPGTTWALQLYSRWGKEVARYDPYENDWDAENAGGGVYYYILTSRVSGKTVKGWIQVLK